MKKWLLFVFVSLLCACDDESEPKLSAGPHPKSLFSELSITKTMKGSSSVLKRTYRYKEKELSASTAEQSFTGGGSLVSFDITAGATSHTYQCSLNGACYCEILYSVNALFLATGAEYKYREAAGDPHSYAMEYTVIDGKYYLASITEFIAGAVYYTLTFDYSRFAAGEIELTQTLLGNDRSRATLRVTHDNKAGIPDVHLNDADFHPLDEHFEALYGGLFGTFDYFISGINKETQTAVSNTRETIEASVEFDADDYPRKITSLSDKKTKADAYFEFEYK